MGWTSTYSEDNGTDVVLEASSADSLLVSLGSTGLISQDETGTDPDSRGAEHQSGGNGVTVVQTTSRNDLHGLTGQGALTALDQLSHGGDEDGGRDITGVTTTLTTLGADNIDTNVERLLDVLGVTDHVHGEDTGTVQPLDDGLGGNTDGRDKELGATLDNDVDELVELALGVVVAKKTQMISEGLARQINNILTWSCGHYRQPGAEAGQHRKERSCRSRSS